MLTDPNAAYRASDSVSKSTTGVVVHFPPGMDLSAWHAKEFHLIYTSIHSVAAAKGILVKTEEQPNVAGSTQGHIPAIYNMSYRYGLG